MRLYGAVGLFVRLPRPFDSAPGHFPTVLGILAASFASTIVAQKML